MSVDITIQDEPGLDALAQEKRWQWRGNEVILHADKHATVAEAIVAADGVARLEAFPNETVTALRVVRRGPHRTPILWRRDGDAPTVTASPGGAATLPIGGRARISAWVNAQQLPRTGTDLDVAKMATWRWDGLDDLTLLVTIFVDASGKVDFASNMLNIFDGKTPVAERRRIKKKLVADCVRFFHQRRIQVFAGFYCDIGAEPAKSSPAYHEWKQNLDNGDAFVKWFRGEPDLAGHGRRLAAFFDDEGIDIDGISFDLEIAGRTDSDNLHHAGLNSSDLPRFRTWYGAIADALAEKERYLAFASAPDIGSGISGHMESQPSSLAQHPNVISRPMSYDNAPVGDKKVSYSRRSATKTGLDKYRLHPAQLQVAQGEATGYSGGPFHATMQREATDFLRSYRVGVIHWAFRGESDARSYAALDAALNPSGPKRGTFGQPLQGPLGATRIEAFLAAGAPDDPDDHF